MFCKAPNWTTVRIDSEMIYSFPNIWAQCGPLNVQHGEFEIFGVLFDEAKA